MSFKLKTLAILSWFGCCSAYSADMAELAGFKTIEEALAIGTLMSDSDALTVGFTNFDLKLKDENFGDDETLNLKNSLNIFAIPYTFKLTPKSAAWEHDLLVRAAYIKIKRNHEGVQLEDGILEGELDEHTFSLFARYGQYYKVTEQWYVNSSLGLHLSYYHNNFSYGPDVEDYIKELLDKNLLNVSTLALIVEPTVGIGYKKKQQWGSWHMHNRTNYIYGHGIAGTVNNPGSINPEGWRLTNGVEFSVDVPELWGVHDFLTIDFKRIDVMGDLENIAEKGYYYETSFGWIIDTDNVLPLLDNIGIGISVNYGSSISGGTLVLYFNE